MIDIYLSLAWSRLTQAVPGLGLTPNPLPNLSPTLTTGTTVTTFGSRSLILALGTQTHLTTQHSRDTRSSFLGRFAFPLNRTISHSFASWTPRVFHLTVRLLPTVTTSPVTCTITISFPLNPICLFPTPSCESAADPIIRNGLPMTSL